MSKHILQANERTMSRPQSPLIQHALIVASLLCSATASAALTLPAQPMIGSPEIVLPHSAPAGAVVLFSGMGGWGETERGLARTLAGHGQIVIGVDLPSTLRHMATSTSSCVTLIGEVEAVSHQIQRDANAQAYHFPVLAGMQAGATMALGVAGQASTATIARVLAVDPEPALPGRKPLCSELQASNRNSMPTYALPAGPLPYGVDILLSTAATAEVRLRATAFAHGRAEIRLTDEPRAAPPVALLNGLNQHALQAGKVAGDGATGADSTPTDLALTELPLADLPLVELPVADAGDTVAILYSGDGGWRDLDKQLAAILQQSGLPVVGVDVLRYFWKRRDPEQCARDLGRIIEAYRQKWGARKVVLIGYSFGADVLPALYNRLAPSDRVAVVQISLLAFAATADFEVTVAGWLKQHRSDALPTLPEVRRIDPQRLQCFYGEDDDESACTQIGKDVELVRTTGSHHFDGDYPALARRIMQGLKQRSLP
jgi:type IV secretory pathway VirJ component